MSAWRIESRLGGRARTLPCFDGCHRRTPPAGRDGREARPTGAVPTPRPGDSRGLSLLRRCAQRDLSPNPDCAGRIAVSRLKLSFPDAADGHSLPRGGHESAQMVATSGYGDHAAGATAKVLIVCSRVLLSPGSERRARARQGRAPERMGPVGCLSPHAARHRVPGPHGNRSPCLGGLEGRLAGRAGGRGDLRQQ